MYDAHYLCGVWTDFGITLGSFWDHVGIILASCWDHVGIILGSSWDHFGIILGSSWDRFGIITASFWHHHRIIVASFWHHHGIILASLRHHSGIMLYHLSIIFCFFVVSVFSGIRMLLEYRLKFKSPTMPPPFDSSQKDEKQCLHSSNSKPSRSLPIDRSRWDSGYRGCPYRS